MEDDVYDVDVKVVRRPEPELPPPFECVICQHAQEADRWHPGKHMPPICRSCEVHWSSIPRVKISRVMRNDFRRLERLSAITTALNWEIYNGGRRSRYFTAQ